MGLNLGHHKREYQRHLQDSVCIQRDVLIDQSSLSHQGIQIAQLFGHDDDPGG
jgi:hypothetical protein